MGRLIGVSSMSVLRSGIGPGFSFFNSSSAVANVPGYNSPSGFGTTASTSIDRVSWVTTGEM